MAEATAQVTALNSGGLTPWSAGSTKRSMCKSFRYAIKKKEQGYNLVFAWLFHLPHSLRGCGNHGYMDKYRLNPYATLGDWNCPLGRRLGSPAEQTTRGDSNRRAYRVLSAWLLFSVKTASIYNNVKGHETSSIYNHVKGHVLHWLCAPKFLCSDRFLHCFLADFGFVFVATFMEPESRTSTGRQCTTTKILTEKIWWMRKAVWKCRCTSQRARRESTASERCNQIPPMVGTKHWITFCISVLFCLFTFGISWLSINIGR